MKMTTKICLLTFAALSLVGGGLIIEGTESFGQSAHARARQGCYYQPGSGWRNCYLK